MVMLLRERARPAFVREHRLAPWLAVGTVCFGAFMGQLDASIVTVAFPALQRQFGTHLAAVQWVSLAYLLALTALLVPVGRWSDRAGRKLFYLYGFIAFAGASAACGFAPSLGALIALRVVQAAGAAMLQANSVALVVTSVPAARRRAALGIQAAAQAIGLASGPVTGGLLVAAAGWRWVFFLNVPVGVIAVLAGLYLLPRTRGLASAGQAGRERAGADPAGMTLLAMSATAGMLAVSALSGLNWPAWVVAGWAVTAVLTAVVLWRHEHRARLRCWTSRRCGRPGLAGRSAAHCAPTSCCSARWCSSRRRSPRGAAAPWRRDFSSRRCRRASAWRRRLPTGSSGRGGLTGPAAPPEAGWPLAAPLASSPALRCSRPPAPRRRPRPPPSWRARCFSACSASAWGCTLRPTTPRSWRCSRPGTRRRQAGW